MVCEGHAKPQILSKPIDEEKVRREVALEAIRRFAETFGIESMKVRIEKQKELGRELDADEEIKLLQNELRKLKSWNSNSKKIISEDKLE